MGRLLAASRSSATSGLKASRNIAVNECIGPIGGRCGSRPESEAALDETIEDRATAAEDVNGHGPWRVTTAHRRRRLVIADCNQHHTVARMRSKVAGNRCVLGTPSHGRSLASGWSGPGQPPSTVQRRPFRTRLTPASSTSRADTARPGQKARASCSLERRGRGASW